MAAALVQDHSGILHLIDYCEKNNTVSDVANLGPAENL